MQFEEESPSPEVPEEALKSSAPPNPDAPPQPGAATEVLPGNEKQESLDQDEGE